MSVLGVSSFQGTSSSVFVINPSLCLFYSCNLVSLFLKTYHFTPAHLHPSNLRHYWKCRWSQSRIYYWTKRVIGFGTPLIPVKVLSGTGVLCFCDKPTSRPKPYYSQPSGCRYDCSPKCDYGIIPANLNTHRASISYSFRLCYELIWVTIKRKIFLLMQKLQSVK